MEDMRRYDRALHLACEAKRGNWKRLAAATILGGLSPIFSGSTMPRTTSCSRCVITRAGQINLEGSDMMLHRPSTPKLGRSLPPSGQRHVNVCHQVHHHRFPQCADAPLVFSKCAAASLSFVTASAFCSAAICGVSLILALPSRPPISFGRKMISISSRLRFEVSG